MVGRTPSSVVCLWLCIVSLQLPWEARLGRGDRKKTDPRKVAVKLDYNMALVVDEKWTLQSSKQGLGSTGSLEELWKYYWIITR